jgi:hypothetical protein
MAFSFKLYFLELYGYHLKYEKSSHILLKILTNIEHNPTSTSKDI